MTLEDVDKILSNPFVQNVIKGFFSSEDDGDARFLRIDEVTDGSPSQLFEDIKLHVNRQLNRKSDSGSFWKDVHLKAVIQNDRRRERCFTVVPMQPVDDIVRFENGEVFTFTWTLVAGHEGEKSNGERHWLLKVPRDCLLLDDYFQHVSEKASSIRHQGGHIDVYTNRQGSFSSEVMWTKRRFAAQTRFRHLHLEHSIMYKLEATLDAFLLENTQDVKFGDPERLGILLQGPPGTGKTKTIAAMANEKGLNIYNLELTSVKSDEDLRQLLDQIEDPCIVAIEDFDESLQHLRSDGSDPFARRSDRLTINGFLNLLGGLRSFGERKRIYVLTANDATVIPPKLLRFGRIDLKLELSYMTTGSLDRLWMSHFEFRPVEFVQLTRRLEPHTRLTAAEAHRLLLDAEGDPDIALNSLHQRIVESIDKRVEPRNKHTSVRVTFETVVSWVAEVFWVFRSDRQH